MARKKGPESTVVGGFTWLHENPASDPKRERWRVNVPTIFVFVTNYGGGPGGEHFTGWRVVAGAPSKEEFTDRDSAMMAARKTIEAEVRGRIRYTQHVIDETNRAMAVLRAAGIPIGAESG